MEVIVWWANAFNTNGLDDIRAQCITEQAIAIVDKQPYKAPAIDTSIGETTSFTSKVTLDGTSTIEVLSLESQASPTEDSHTTITLQESAPLSEEVSSSRRLYQTREQELRTTTPTLRKAMHCRRLFLTVDRSTNSRSIKP